MLIGGETLSAHRARPRKIPGWTMVVRENFSLIKRAYRTDRKKLKLHQVSFLSAFFLKFYLWLSPLSSKKVEDDLI